MVLPTDNQRFNFRDKSDSREKMTAYIRENFSGMLGDDARLLNMPNGLEILQAKVRAQLAQSGVTLDRGLAKAA